MPGVGDRQSHPGGWPEIQEQAIRLERAWNQADGSAPKVEISAFLPRADHPLRLQALHLMIRVDLAARRRRSQKVLLESYLKSFPELGTVQTLPAELILEEYRVREELGERLDPATYRARFPGQFPRLQQLLKEKSQRPPADRSTPAMPPLPGTIDPDLASHRTLGRSVLSLSGNPPVPAPELATGAALPASAAAGVSGVVPVVGGYKLIKRLGQGTFGEVWKAEGPGGTEVAIKVITRPVDHAQAKQELKALEHVKRFRHPYLVQTQAYWVFEDRLCILMDLADGTLADRYQECRAAGLPGIPADELADYTVQSAAALDYIHEEGVHHRDIKPANILLLKGYARVADLGLARPLQNTMVDATAGGTPAFMPPEVWQQSLSPHSDQWSLAATYAGLRIKRRLFKASGMVGLMMEISAGPPDLSDFPEPERNVLLRALALDPEARYPSCTAFAQALKVALAPPPPVVPPARAPTPWWVWGLLLSAPLLILAAMVLFLKPSGRTEPVSEPPQVEVEPLGDYHVPTGGTVSIPVVIRRQSFEGEVRISCEDPLLPAGLKVEPATVAAGEDRATIRFAALQNARPTVGVQRVILLAQALGPDDKPLASAQATLQYSVHYLPAGFRNEGDETAVDGRGVSFFKRIRFAKDGADVPFVLIPQKPQGKLQEGEPALPTFYIMQDKASLGLFRQFAKLHADKVKSIKWKREKSGPDLPVLEVTVTEAHAFASEWMRGLLPTKQQWDRAAGRYESPPALEGPYEGKWAEGRKDIGVNRAGPMPLAAATGDRSKPFDCRNMSGNGLEWTRTLLDGRLVPIRAATPTSLDDLVELRGCRYDAPRPLQFQDIADAPEGKRYTETSPQMGFRVVIETP